MKQLVFLLAFFSTGCVLAQLEQRSAITVAGSTSEVVQDSKRYYISESVGQQSVVGTVYNEALIARQGFQQPPFSIQISEEIISNWNITVFPNPVTDAISVQISEENNEAMIAVIFDVQGREIQRRTFNTTASFQLDVSSLSSGNYLLNIFTKQQQYSSKLIKK